MKITDEMEAQILFYEHTLDCEDRAGMYIGVSIFTSRAQMRRLMAFSYYYDLDNMFNTASIRDNYRFGDLKVFTEWYIWQKSLPMPNKVYLELVNSEGLKNPIIEQDISVKEALFLAEEYEAMGIFTTIKRMSEMYK